MNEGQRAFSEKDAAEILQRAAKLQEHEEAKGYTPGITLDELARIATEAGIDPKYLGQALSSPVPIEGSPRLLGMGLEVDRVYEGELDPDDFDAVIECLGVGKKQMVRQVGRSVTGQVQAGLAMATMEITARNGRTRLRVKSSPFVAYFATLHWMGILGIVLGASTGARLGPVMGALVGLLMLSVGLVSFWFAGQAGRKSTDQLVSKLDQAIRGAIADRHGIAATQASAIAEEEAAQLRLGAGS